MNDRLKKIERILSVQGKLHKLAEARLAALDRERQELSENEASLVDALNRDDPLHGIFVEAMARRLSALAREADKINRAREAQSRVLTEAGLQLRRTERMTDRVRREFVKQLGKRTFADFLETLNKVDDASLP
jgi:hypothetical protein